MDAKKKKNLDMELQTDPCKVIVLSRNRGWKKEK